MPTELWKGMSPGEVVQHHRRGGEGARNLSRCLSPEERGRAACSHPPTPTHTHLWVLPLVQTLQGSCTKGRAQRWRIPQPWPVQPPASLPNKISNISGALTMHSVILLGYFS